MIFSINTTPTILRLEQADNQKYSYIITINSQSPHFNIKNLSRNLGDIYKLYNIMKEGKKDVPPLPMKAFLWLASNERRLNILAKFLVRLLSSKDFIENQV